MTHPRTRARVSLAALALLGGLALAGCGDDGDGSGTAEPSGSATATTSEPASGDTGDTSDASSETAEPSEDASTTGAPTAAPATGPAMQLDGMSLNAPAGWEIGTDSPLNQGAYNAGGGPGAMVVTLLSAVPGESFETTLDGALESATTDGLEPQRLDDITLDGVETWVVTGAGKDVALQYTVGGLAGGDTFVISFQFLTEPPPDVQATIDGVLATVVFDAA